MSDDAAGTSTGSGGAPNASAIAPSCAPGGPGKTTCGANRESCCTSLEVPGGKFYRTYDLTDAGLPMLPADGGPTGEADPATVSPFRLDKYVVTVGRFREFVSAVLPSDGGAGGWLPQAGSGKHTALNNGQGVANSGPGGGYEPGWVVSDDSNIAPTDTHLGSCVPDSTWTSAAARNENLPITCVNWWESYAFCIWDGGFLPSNAEWEYAAAGGSEQREYPWGSMAPGSANQYAVYGDDQGNCYYPSGTLAPCTGVSNIAPVGTANLGAGRWGQLDLAGDVFEWNMDWFAPNVDPCTDCAYLTATFGRDFQGGSFHFDASGLLPSNGGEDAPSTRGADIGFRCARSAP